MAGRSDRHFRWLVRRISRHAILYTEMVPARAMEAGRASSLLTHDADVGPVVLQLGGSDPDRLARSAAQAEALGFAEVNLNCGCPSPAAGHGAFGARLMKDPPRVARCVAAMRTATRLPVTVKQRIGVDGCDAWDDLVRFVDTVAEAGVRRFIVHARSAWLQGLSPAQNRNVPPLRYALVKRLAAARPSLAVELNGGIASVTEVRDHLAAAPIDGVMLGRAVFHDPMVLATADRDLFGADTTVPARAALAQAALDYAARWEASGGRYLDAIRPMLGIFRRLPGGRRIRAELTGGYSVESSAISSSSRTRL